MTLSELWQTLGITSTMVESCRLPLYDTEPDLVDAGCDVFERRQQMTPHTLQQWQAMKIAASDDDIELQLVSAFRSVEYQCELIRRKIETGIPIEEIVTVNAIPGFSEHHTGRALDLTTPGCEPLSEAFEVTTAFSWLQENASDFAFSLSYPRDNPFGIIYEPWHWTCNS